MIINLKTMKLEHYYTVYRQNDSGTSQNLGIFHGNLIDIIFYLAKEDSALHFVPLNINDDMEYPKNSCEATISYHGKTRSELKSYLASFDSTLELFDSSIQGSIIVKKEFTPEELKRNALNKLTQEEKDILGL